uniref:Protein kinase domain-containing protein n=1 Tax=Haemonchus contortus TaxID=6289 RepID=A0A7I4YDZ2_HAECO
MSTSSSVPKPEITRDAIICDWKVIRKIGSGGFGAVYEVEKDGVRAALKTEFVDQTGERSETLRNEVMQLRVMQWSSHFCRLYLACRVRCGKSVVNIMIMSLVERPLSRLRRMTPCSRFTRSTAVRLSRQCLEAIHDLHRTGILHRDIKASNFAWSSERIVYLLDLGFCRRFLTFNEQDEMKHRAPRKKVAFLGTSRYCSPNMHKKLDQGRRDDLWAWLYMTVEFMAGKLIWRNDEDKVIERKKEKIGSKLLAKCPQEMYMMYDHIRSLEFDSKPNYPMLRRQLDRVCARLDFHEDQPYDWEEGGYYYEYFNKKSDTEKDLTGRDVKEANGDEEDQRGREFEEINISN